jgi:hypothetical protein
MIWQLCGSGGKWRGNKPRAAPAGLLRGPGSTGEISNGYELSRLGVRKTNPQRTRGETIVRQRRPAKTSSQIGRPVNVSLNEGYSDGCARCRSRTCRVSAGQGYIRCFFGQYYRDPSMRGDRDLKLSGYEVFRFGTDELNDWQQARTLLQQFFTDLFQRFGVAPQLD